MPTLEHRSITGNRTAGWAPVTSPMAKFEKDAKDAMTDQGFDGVTFHLDGGRALEYRLRPEDTT